MSPLSVLLLKSFAITVATVQLAYGYGFNGPMHFSLHAPCHEQGGTCSAYLLAEGEITGDTPLEFDQVVRNLNSRPIVYFNSPGGSLFAALKLGRRIRQLGFNTHVGGPYRDVSAQNKDTTVVVAHGSCLSACVYTFMGGRIREIDDGGVVGVHQFRTIAGDSGEGSAQITVAVLAEYLNEMGVERTLLDVASVTEPSQMQPVSTALARSLNLDNTDPPKAPWRLWAQSTGTLTLRNSQRQPRNDASISIIMLPQDDSRVTISMVYVINANPGTPDYSVLQTPRQFQFVTTSGSVYSGTTIWTVRNPQKLVAGFDVPLALLEQLARTDRFAISWSWPSSLREFDPTIDFGTVNFANSVRAIYKSRRPPGF